METATLKQMNTGIIGTVVIAVDDQGKVHTVYVLDKCKQPHNGCVKDMFLCLESNGEVFYTDNIKHFCIKKQQDQYMEEHFNKFFETEKE